MEDVVNEKINSSLPVYAFVAPLEQASKTIHFLLLCSLFLIVCSSVESGMVSMAILT